MKKTALIAAVALASSVLSSQAGVYSQNIVGYANLPAQNGANTLLNCQFNVGASNGLNEIFGNSLPAASEVLIWNPAELTYNLALYDNTDPDGLGAGAPVWYEGDDYTPLSPLPCLTPGVGFWLVAAGTITNVFAGTVPVSLGSTNSLNLSAGQTLLVGCPLPYAGVITNGNCSTGGGANLNGLPAHSKLQLWDPIHSQFNIVIYDNTNPDHFSSGAPLWYRGDDQTPYVDPNTGLDVPSIAVGQAFFIQVPGVYFWETGL